jgi:hypothetical protein
MKLLLKNINIDGEMAVVEVLDTAGTVLFKKLK